MVLASDTPEAEEIEAAASAMANRRGPRVTWESPEEVIPLPPRHERRHRPAGIRGDCTDGPFEVLHFDPYGVALRLITRGDQPDYQTVLRYLRAGWLTAPEFRRKFKGLVQMWMAANPAGRPRSA